MGQIGEKEKKKGITRTEPTDPWVKTPAVTPVKEPEQVPVPVRRTVLVRRGD